MMIPIVILNKIQTILNTTVTIENTIAIWKMVNTTSIPMIANRTVILMTISMILFTMVAPTVYLPTMIMKQQM